MKAFFIALAALIIIGLGVTVAIVLMKNPQPTTPPVVQQPGQGQSTLPPVGEDEGTTVNYQCDGSKTITAVFHDDTAPASTTASGAPVPTGSVDLTLSDGRTMTLAQTVSADGARYSNGDPSVAGGETFAFWSKGRGAVVLENNQPKNYIGCVEVANDPGGLSKVYSNGTEGFSIRYPSDYAVDAAYKYQELGPGKDISGVKFTIPASMTSGTNLSSDSYVSVEQIPQATTCSASLFLDQAPEPTTVTVDGTDYSVASSTGAAAGNRYEEMVYAIPGTTPCIAMRSFIHYGVLENYDPGTVKAFDRDALLETFNKMRGTLVIVQ